MNSLDAAIATQPEAHVRGYMLFLSSQLTYFSHTSHRKNVLEEGKGTNIRQNSFNLIVLRGREYISLVVSFTLGCL